MRCYLYYNIKMMQIAKLVTVCFIINCLPSCQSVTHWIQSNELIIPLLSSPYYLKNSHDLVAFLNQSVYKKKLDDLMKELILIKSNLTQKMNRLDLFSNELPNKISCIPEFFIDESDLSMNQLSKTYLNRINFKPTSEKVSKTPQPKCSEFGVLDFSFGLFEHLESMKKRHKLKMEAEGIFGSKELGISNSNFPHIMYTSLKSNPLSWKFYLLSSFYWRFKGNAKEAIDIPLLSLGTILQRSNFINDSVVVIKAAVDHAPNVAENFWSLCNVYLMLSQFNKSLECFHKVEQLDSAYSVKVDFIKKSISCFRDLKITLITMENSLDEILPGLERYGALKKEFEEYHEKLEREQVPLKTRYFDENFEEHKNHLIQRSQICSTRFKENDEPILFCDFLSDIQLVMQDFALDILNNYVELKKELIATYKINSLGIYKKIFVENYSEQ
ncbi:CLUMA_CG017833, isoform A [Clunio marinus]|uniref:CLUMA_CG017833, isoform A n=1 Tax=Clunio marinus TaxID=568069 RepID=A0A1J1IX40_9DIPT|nr:CLUMA_CG017833, isoform A [Clunio marinus]